jgi:hypothetical protein
MKTHIAAITMMIVLAIAPAVYASGKKDNKCSVSFHMQTEAGDDPKMVFTQLTNGKMLYFRRVPEFSLVNMVAFAPFPADIGEDYGIAFKVKGNLIGRLAAISNANQGKWMVSQINGRVVGGVMIDKQIDDGVLVIWKGVTLAEIALLDAALPRIGAKEKK